MSRIWRARRAPGAGRIWRHPQAPLEAADAAEAASLQSTPPARTLRATVLSTGIGAELSALIEMGFNVSTCFEANDGLATKVSEDRSLKVLPKTPTEAAADIEAGKHPELDRVDLLCSGSSRAVRLMKKQYDHTRPQRDRAAAAGGELTLIASIQAAHEHARIQTCGRRQFW